MGMTQAYDADITIAVKHRLRMTHHVLGVENATLAELVEPMGDGPARVLVFFDAEVVGHDPGVLGELHGYVKAHADRIAMPVGPIVIPGGEAAKNDPRHIEPLLREIVDAGLDRQSYVIVIGGGAVLDAVGLAASLAHRGIRLIRIPTTTLSQADSGVGVKNGVNAFGQKNFVGVFATPWAVINDSAFLATLSDQDWVCGFAEVVKVALLKDAALFEQVERDGERVATRDMAAAGPLIDRSALLHFRHITDGGDPFELTSARPLDFGHWAAHRLETLSDYQVRHGEAVAIGLALDVTYAQLAGICDPSVTQRVIRCLATLGLPTYDDHLERRDLLFEGLDEFRCHLGGVLTITLIRDVGDPVDVHEIDRKLMADAIDTLAPSP